MVYVSIFVRPGNIVFTPHLRGHCPRMVPLTTPVLNVLDGIKPVDGNPWAIQGTNPRIVR